ncbi:MAG: hypothetical protein LPL00_03585 [Alphaproteobacteria bacterium]|nr:hypothetical protein [Alphaproteobacteria bacterium]MDX5368568.1 hypothetical protein [Alphaproteobacteria bacterium]MDX5463319.1 hypothetical protein [Alphaproteobacteria bacterium]
MGSDIVSIERDGKTYSGQFELNNGIVTVWYRDKKKATQLGGSPVEVIARQLLSEILRGL